MSTLSVKKYAQTLTVKIGNPSILHVTTKTVNTIVAKATGARGPRGEQGERGEQGIGIQGERGPRGDPGAPADTTALNNLSVRIDALTSTVTDIRSLAPEALNAFSEVASALNNDPNFAATMTTALARRVRFDAAQALNSTERTVARSNIDAASVADVTGKLSKDSYVRSLQIIVSGKPPANALLGGGIVAQAGTIDVQASSFRADTAATANTILTLKINATTAGTVTFAAGSLTGLLAVSSTALVTGDKIALYMGGADATLAGIIGSLVVRL